MSEKMTDLEVLRIHELRDLARKMGVNAPTSKKKESLIEEIMKIMNGEALPVLEKSKKGRPVRNSVDNFDVVDLILPSQEELTSFNDSYAYESSEERMRFMINMDKASYDDVEDDENAYVEGYVEIKAEGFAVLHVEGLCSGYKDVFVNRNLVKQLNLRTGEKIGAKTRKIKENYPHIAYEIVKENSNNNVVYDELSPEPLGADITISTNELKSFKLGGRYFVKPSNDAYEVVGDIAEAIKKQSPNTIVETLFLNAMIERIPYGKDIVVNSIPFSKTDEDVIIGTNLYFEKLKRMVENTGKDVVVVVNEVSQFAKSYNNVALKNSNFNEISNMTTYKIKRLLSCAKYTANGSITIIAVDKLRVPQNIENLFRYEILPLFNN